MCETDPNGQVCALVKKGFYDGKMKMAALPPSSPGWLSISHANGATPAAPKSQPARPRQARVVPLPSKDFLRVLQPNAFLAAGFDFEKMFRVPEVMEALLGSGEGSGDPGKLLAALQETDHMWLSIAPPNDVVLLMTGKFERGAAAGLFYSQGIMPVFLGDAHAMMIGPEPSIQAALARMARPPVNEGWAARRAREISKDHETWIVTELPKSADHAANSEAVLQHIRRFSLGFRLTGDASLDGEAVTDSPASAQEIGTWIDRIKNLVREKTGSGVLDPLKVSLDGPALRFEAKDSGFLTGDAGKTAMNSDFGVELYQIVMAGFPGTPARIVAADKIAAVQTGMKRDDVLHLLGTPLTVSAIQGLETPRETWFYQVPFGKQFKVRFEDGVVTQPPY